LAATFFICGSLSSILQNLAGFNLRTFLYSELDKYARLLRWQLDLVGDTDNAVDYRIARLSRWLLRMTNMSQQNNQSEGERSGLVIGISPYMNRRKQRKQREKLNCFSPFSLLPPVKKLLLCEF